jgi:hypothetical protein
VKYNPIIEVTDPQFSIRSRTRVDMAKTWFNWVSTVNQELGHKETRIVYDEVTATGTATETE